MHILENLIKIKNLIFLSSEVGGTFQQSSYPASRIQFPVSLKYLKFLGFLMFLMQCHAGGIVFKFN
jgi:hypothetical protein